MEQITARIALLVQMLADWLEFIFAYYTWASTASQTLAYKLRPVIPTSRRFPDAITT